MAQNNGKKPNNSKNLKNTKTNTKTANTKTVNKNKKPKQKSRKKKIIIRVLIGLAILLLIVAGIGAGVIFSIFQKYTIPIDKLRISTENTRIIDIDGNLIATLNASEKRDVITIQEMAKYLPTAFVAIEDERFYEHQGIDIKRTAAATISYVFKGDSSFGGSTITQQLVKNITNEDQRDATRKIKEMARAYNLEKTMPKDEILALYLNMIFMGEDVYGVQMGAKLYFNKSASELDLAECAFLAGINNSPNAYKPFSDDPQMKEKIKTRTLTVINKMHDLKKIESEEVYREAVEKVQNGLPFTKGNISENVYSYHTDALIQQVISQIQAENPEMTYQAAEYYLYNGGLTIYSTQNTAMQTVMENEYKNKSYLINSKLYYVKDAEGKDTNVRATTQSAMVIIDHTTGQVKACVGGFGEKTARGLNRATQQPQQPGSTIKPIAVIAPSLEAGLITAGTVVDDTPLSGGYQPKNSGGGYTGLMTVRQIIKVSRNIPEVKMIRNLGPEKSVEFLKQLGLKYIDERDANPATALGGLTQGATAFEMAGAYAAIANDGVYIEPIFFTKVVDANNNVVLEAKQETRRVMSVENAYILKSILRGPLEGGGTAAGLGVKIPNMDTCGKTGTTDVNQRWFCGFTPYFTAATWYGYDKDEKLYTGNTAGVIWGKVMKNCHEGLPAKSFTRPSNIVSMTICNKSGMIPTELCKEAGCTYSEIFVKGTTPAKPCDVHVKERVCVHPTGEFEEDGTEKVVVKLLTEFCPNVEERIFITRENSDKDRAWEKAKDKDLMLPEETCDIHNESTVTPSPEPSATPGTSPTPSAAPGTPGVWETVAPTATPTITPTTTPTVTPTITPVPTIIITE